MEIIDAHLHIDAAKFDEARAELTALGISKVISSPLPLANSAEELNQSNREALELYKKDPDFYYPAVMVHPGFPEESLRALREFADKGLIWAGEWLAYTSNINFDQPQWQPFFDFAAEHDMIVQMHNHESVAVIAARYPELTIVGSHLNPNVLPLLTEHKNVFLDISGMHGGLVRKALEDAVALFGSKRLLFGTDYPGYDAEPFIIRCQRYLPGSEIAGVFSGNVRKIMADHGKEL